MVMFDCREGNKPLEIHKDETDVVFKIGEEFVVIHKEDVIKIAEILKSETE